jgi:hypothetical protein
MSKKKKETKEPSTAAPAGEQQLQALMAAGDYRAARAEAKRLLLDPAASEADKQAARDALDRTGVDKGVLAAGLIALAVLLVAAILLYLRK